MQLQGGTFSDIVKNPNMLWSSDIIQFIAYCYSVDKTPIKYPVHIMSYSEMSGTY